MLHNLSMENYAQNENFPGYLLPSFTERMMLEESAYLQEKIGQLLGEGTEMITTGNSVIYKITGNVIKSFYENDQTIEFKQQYLLNHVFERQIKRVIQFFNWDTKYFYDVELLVLSPEKPPKLLDYSSSQQLNSTLDMVDDPEELEYRIYQALDYLVNLH